jgi:hypothetical protein
MLNKFVYREESNPVEVPIQPLFFPSKVATQMNAHMWVCYSHTLMT